jgi:hypothetical protein
MKKQKEDSKVRSVAAVPSFVDLGLGGWLSPVDIFASDLVQSLSLDTSKAVGDQGPMALALCDALRVYSYSLEQQKEPEEFAEEVARFVRLQSQ